MGEGLLAVLLTAVLGRILSVFSVSLGSFKNYLRFAVSLTVTVMLLSPLLGMMHCGFKPMLTDTDADYAGETGAWTQKLQLEQTERVLCEEICMMTAARFSIDKDCIRVAVAFDATDRTAVRLTDVSVLIFSRQNRILCEKIEAYLHGELLCPCRCRYGGETAS